MLHEIFLMHFTFSFERQKNLLHQSHTEFGILICRAVVQNARLALINAMYRNLCLRISFGCWYVSWIDYDWRSQRASAHNLWWLHTSSILPSPPPYHQNPWIFSALYDKIYEELQNQQHWYVYFSMTVFCGRAATSIKRIFFKTNHVISCVNTHSEKDKSRGERESEKGRGNWTRKTDTWTAELKHPDEK